MKQHITKEQWNELDEKCKATLIYAVEKVNQFEPKLLTIGQMIEFLGDEGGDIGYPYQEIITIEKGHWECFNGWQVKFWKRNPPRCSECNQIKHNNKETAWCGQSWGSLCDALWEAVKEKLK